jgi:hypothetical protein
VRFVGLAMRTLSGVAPAVLCLALGIALLALAVLRPVAAFLALPGDDVPSRIQDSPAGHPGPAREPGGVSEGRADAAASDAP